MCRPDRTCLIALLLAVAASSGCDRRETATVRGREVVVASASERAARRLYDGAPPVIPHAPFAMRCMSCHGDYGMAVAGLGVAPPSPHGDTPGLSAGSRCAQCHVFVKTDGLFRPNGYRAMEREAQGGDRLYPGAPPRLPHRLFMRESCPSCHAGPAARSTIRTTHPERTRCLQCHVPIGTSEPFVPEGTLPVGPPGP